MIDPNEAPKGFKAVPTPDRDDSPCIECDARNTEHCWPDCRDDVSCLRTRRKDGEDVIFKKAGGV